MIKWQKNVYIKLISFQHIFFLFNYSFFVVRDRKTVNFMFMLKHLLRRKSMKFVKILNICEEYDIHLFSFSIDNLEPFKLH